MTEINTGDTAWMIVATALVLMMTPALGLFYAGLVRSKNSLNTFMMSIATIAVVAVSWTVVGYSLAFDEGVGFVGGLDHAFLSGVDFEPREGSTIPHLLFFAYQGTFCILTAALVSGAVVERMRFGTYLAFIALWSIFVYPVMAQWVFGGGFLAEGGTLDFAGGVPVEMASGFSALAATLIVWFVLDLLRARRITAIGAATAIIVGCVSITPAAGFVSPGWALALGALGAIPSWAFIVWRPKTRLDETLDVLAAHGIAGFLGILFIGFFAQESWNGISDGLAYGNGAQLGDQALAVLTAPPYAFAATFLLLKIVGAVAPLRVTERVESIGLDISEHGEEAYASGEGAILLTTEAEVRPPVPVAQP